MTNNIDYVSSSTPLVAYTSYFNSLDTQTNLFRFCAIANEVVDAFVSGSVLGLRNAYANTMSFFHVSTAGQRDTVLRTEMGISMRFVHWQRTSKKLFRNTHYCVHDESRPIRTAQSYGSS